MIGTPVILGIVAVFGVFATVAVWRRRTVASRAVDLLDASRFGGAVAIESEVGRRDLLQTVVADRVAVVVAATSVFGVAHLFGVAFSLSAAVAGVVAVLTWIARSAMSERRRLRVRTELADALDLQISALRSGASMIDALTVSVAQTRGLMQRVFDAALGRLRLGEAPEPVFRAVERSLPLSEVRLYVQALAAQWKSGGSLAPTLVSVGRSIRDRIELSRRVRAQASEARFSVIGVLAITWFIGIVAWRSAPERFEMFAGSPIGGDLLASCVLLQAVGLIWMAKISKAAAVG